MIKLWGFSGEDFMVETDETTPDGVLSEFSTALSAMIDANAREGDWDYAIRHWMPQICEIWAKLRGYKADSVREMRVLRVGQLDEVAATAEPTVSTDSKGNVVLGATALAWAGHAASHGRAEA